MNVQATDKNFDRLAKLFVDAGTDESRERATERLFRSPMQLVCGSTVEASETLQLAAAAIVACGSRAFPAGVQIVSPPAASRVRFGPALFQELLANEGSTLVESLNPQLPTISIGAGFESTPLHCPLLLKAIPRNWAAGVIPGHEEEAPPLLPGPLGAALAGSLAVCELFHAVHGLHPMAGNRSVGLSFFQPDAPWWEGEAVGPSLSFLPKKIWLLGLGHLGQANAWLLRSLPWAQPGDVAVWLQDTDVISPENVGTSLLSQPVHVGQSKCRRIADVLESRGLKTRIIELLFRGGQARLPAEPDVALVGFDKASARRPLDSGGWGHLVDAGIGAGAGTFSQFVLHRLGGRRRSAEIFDVEDNNAAERLLRDVAAYRSAAQKDRCGALQMAEQAVGTSFVGLTTAVASIAEILRPHHGGLSFETLAGDLTRSPTRLELAVREKRVGNFERVDALPLQEGRDQPTSPS